MKLGQRLTRILVASLPVLALFAMAAPSDTPSFHPEAGASLTKAFTQRFDFDLDDLSIVVGGNDLAGMIGAIEMSLSNTTTLRVEDVYDEVTAGRPAKLSRTFETLDNLTSVSVSAAGEGEDQEMPSSSELEGRTVVFTWNADEGAYDVTFAEEGGDPALLEGLEEDMDLRVLLPAGEVEKDAEWTVEIAQLRSLITPGGELSLLSEDAEEEDFAEFEEMFERFGDDLSKLLEGTCKCTYKGAREVDGASIGEILVAIEIASSSDLSDMLEELITKLAEENDVEAPEVTIDSADLTIDFDGEGTLLWNLAEGRVHSFELSGAANLAVDIGVTGPMTEEAGGDIEASAEFSGTITQTVATE